MFFATLGVPLIDLLWGNQADRVVTIITSALLFILILTRVFALMQALEKGQDRLRHDAEHDALTGLANRVLFAERTKAALARRSQASGRGALHRPRRLQDRQRQPRSPGRRPAPGRGRRPAGHRRPRRRHGRPLRRRRVRGAARVGRRQARRHERRPPSPRGTRRSDRPRRPRRPGRRPASASPWTSTAPATSTRSCAMPTSRCICRSRGARAGSSSSRRRCTRRPWSVSTSRPTCSRRSTRSSSCCTTSRSSICRPARSNLSRR